MRVGWERERPSWRETEADAEAEKSWGGGGEGEAGDGGGQAPISSGLKERQYRASGDRKAPVWGGGGKLDFAGKASAAAAMVAAAAKERGVGGFREVLFGPKRVLLYL